MLANCKKSFKLTKQQEAKIRELEAKYCTADEDSSRLTLLSATEPSARQCAKFVEMCGRRIDDLKACGATSVECLSATNQRRDRDFRFGYDFVHRVLNGLPFDMQAQVRAAVGPALKEGGMPPLKADYASKLHASECVLGDSLPRPRMPKSLRQFYGNSADAETRIMTFFHRVHEVDSFLNGLEFQDCSYCHEGWFGSSLARAELPGKFESQTYKKTNFLRASVDKWLQPDRPICQNCLQEAKARAEQGLPQEPFRLTGANHADPGESLPETDALTFFEEELLSPIQHIVRIFTLHATGRRQQKSCFPFAETLAKIATWVHSVREDMQATDSSRGPVARDWTLNSWSMRVSLLTTQGDVTNPWQKKACATVLLVVFLHVDRLFVIAACRVQVHEFSKTWQ